MRELPAGTVTFLFTDVEGSTPLLGRLGDAYPPLLVAHERILREALAAHGGVEIKTEGDAFFVAFADAGSALAAALDAQRALLRHPWPTGDEIRVRMGLHTGEARPVNGDYISLAVNLAARVAAAAHGGQIVATDAVASAATAPPGAELAVLGRFRFRGFPDPVAVLEVRHPELKRGHPALRALPAAAHNFRADRSTFFGRTAELAELADLLADTHLLTLTGPGGAGKTRLAREMALRIAPTLQDGAWFVDLSPQPAGGRVVPVVAHELGVGPVPGRDLEDALTDELASREMLVILDNCEHILDAAAAFADRVLDACPGVRLLTTSRQRLGVPGELVWPVPPLATADATALFTDRVGPGRLAGDEPKAIADICRRLDGLPLALELAAVRVVEGMSPPQVLERLERRFDLLEGGTRPARAGHRTLRAVIEWSYELLDPIEQPALRRASVFAGAFTLEAAEAVLHGATLPVGRVPMILGSLVEKSLVLLEEGGRYRVLETVREYGRLQLAALEEENEAYARHREWALRVARRREDEVLEREAFDRIAAEFDELRAAVERCLVQGPAADGLDLCLELGRFLTDRGYHEEGEGWFASLLTQLPDLEPARRARALHRVGTLRWRLGRSQAARSDLETALELAEACSDTPMTGRCLTMLGAVHSQMGDSAAAEQMVRRASVLLAGAGPHLREMRCIALNNLAYLVFSQGRVDEARHWYEELHAEGGDDLQVRSMVHTGLFDVAFAKGDVTTFRSQVLAAIEAHEAMGDQPELAYAISTAGAMEGLLGAAASAQLLGAGRGILRDGDFLSPEIMDEREQAAAQRLRDALGDHAFEEAWTTGLSLGPKEAYGVAVALISSSADAERGFAP